METDKVQNTDTHFDMMAGAAGVVIIAERREGVLAAYRSLLAMAGIVRASATPDEPANVFVLETIVRAR